MGQEKDKNLFFKPLYKALWIFGLFRTSEKIRTITEHGEKPKQNAQAFHFYLGQHNKIAIWLI